MTPFLLVGIGGFIGSILRYSVSVVSPAKLINGIPIATLLVNLLGSFAIGFFMLIDRKLSYSNLTLFIIPGILGGFTTYSAFSAEVMMLIKNQQIYCALMYIFISLFFGIFLAGLGYYLGKQIFAL